MKNRFEKPENFSSEEGNQSFGFPITIDNIDHWKYYVDSNESCRGFANSTIEILNQLEELIKWNDKAESFVLAREIDLNPLIYQEFQYSVANRIVVTLQYRGNGILTPLVRAERYLTACTFIKILGKCK
jgi:hypothetical protein